MQNNSNNIWDIVITPDRGWFNLDLMGLWHYRDLIRLFVRRDLVSQYKQTILGPLYFAITPIVGTLINTLIFEYQDLDQLDKLIKTIKNNY